MILFYVGIGVLAVLGFTHAEQVVEKAEEVKLKVTNKWNQYDPLFLNAGAKYNVDWTWLKAIALNESRLGEEPSVARGIANPYDVENSKSFDGLSWGLMQVTIKTAWTMDPSATEVKLNNPEYSVDLAARYISKLKGYFSESDPRFQEWVIKSYNQGPGNTKKEIAGQTKGYAQAYWERFQRNLERVIA